MAVESGEWTGLATRLVANAQVVSAAVHSGSQPASSAEAAEFVLGMHHLVDALTAASIRIGLAYRDQLPDDIVDQFRAAVVHMRAVSLDHVAEALAQARR